MHPSLLRWALRREPAGRRRLATAYLTAAAGSAVAMIILGITLLISRHCQVSGRTGFGCMAPFFHGLGLSIIAGLLVIVGVSIFVKLGLRFVLTLLALASPVLLITQLFAVFGVESRPYVLIVLIAAPAAAAWISERMLRDRRSETTRPAVERPAELRRHEVAATRL